MDKNADANIQHYQTTMVYINKWGGLYFLTLKKKYFYVLVRPPFQRYLFWVFALVFTD